MTFSSKTMSVSCVVLCFGFFLTLVPSIVVTMCPHVCNCTEDTRGRPQVICANGDLLDNIPVSQMENNIYRLVVTAPADNLNTLAVSRIFYKFTVLREIHITNSLLPAIGEGSFKGLAHLEVLNLTDNNITQILESNFQSLGQLKNLHLDRNNIRHMPSAAFHNLPNLKRLTISHNRITLLVTRLFLNLTNLEVLDLRANPLQQNVDADIFRDVRHLKVLNLSECSQTLFNSMLLRHLPFLEVLDLSHNRLQYFSIDDAHYAPRLKELYLHGNRISSIIDNTFGGLDLRVLTLGQNQLQFLRREAFMNVSVRELDLSYNQVEITDPYLLIHVADKLMSLYIGGNRLTQSILGQMLRNLTHLQSLGMGGLGIEELHHHLIQFPVTLRSLNISNNALSRLPARVLVDPRHLQMIDLSRNQFRGLDQDLLDRFDAMRQLRTIYLQDNPWSCDLCYIPSLMVWLNQSRQFNRACRPNAIEPHDPRLCLRCDTPFELAGRAFQLMDDSLLAGCHGDGPQRSVAFHRSGIGFMVICVLIVLLLVTVILVLLMYYRRGADYYTHEEERDDRDQMTYENAGVDDGETGDLLNKSTKTGFLTPLSTPIITTNSDGNGHMKQPPPPPPPHHHHHHHHQQRAPYLPYLDSSRDNGGLGDDQC